MKPRKDQTAEQRIMRDMGALIIAKLPEGADKRFALRQLWKKCPYGYKNVEAFYRATIRLPEKQGTVIEAARGFEKLFYSFQPLKSRGLRKVQKKYLAHNCSTPR